VYKGKMHIIIFKLLEEYFALGLDYVKEIVCVDRITKVPMSPEYFKGVINIRGQVIPVIDLLKMLKTESKIGNSNNKKIIIIEFQDELVGIVVNEVLDVMEIECDKLKQSPKDTNALLYEYDGNVVTLLDILNLLKPLTQ